MPNDAEWSYSVVTVTVEHAAVLRRAYGHVPEPRANDGIVPTLSQIWGDMIAAVSAEG